jgi:hypothetical protein
MTFQGNGYITLSDIDTIVSRLDAIEKTLGDVDDTVTGAGNLLFYANGSATTLPAMISLTKAAIEVVRVKINVTSAAFSHIFAQPFNDVPVITATIDGGTKDKYACQILAATKTAVTITPLLIAGNGKNTKGDEFINIIAIGKTA